MTDAMLAKERASIREFGFLDPLTVRTRTEPHTRTVAPYEIIDGEHRWVAGRLEGIEEFPCIVLELDDDEARELTIILNDTRGTMQEDRLSALMADLATRRDGARMEALLPYDKGRIDQLVQRRVIDWDELEHRRPPISRKRDEEDPWVERVYRMPGASAKVVDEAIARVRDEGIDQDWRALEMIAADYLGG
jgi:ParB-like chromosome segregation protein Spo0J